jgi:hypothetical protein
MGLEYTIGELAARFGLATHVLRHWEDVGLLSPAAPAMVTVAASSTALARRLMGILSTADMSVHRGRPIYLSPSASGRATRCRRRSRGRDGLAAPVFRRADGRVVPLPPPYRPLLGLFTGARPLRPARDALVRKNGGEHGPRPGHR